MKCSNCGFENRSSLKFCEECGQALDKPALVDNAKQYRTEIISKPEVQPAKRSAIIICTGCGQANRPEVQFCEECGHTLDKHGLQPVTTSAKTTCLACGHSNRSEVQFCEECGTALQRSVAPRGLAGRAIQFLLKWNLKRVAIACLAFVVLAVLVFVGIDRLQYPVTRGEARDKAGTIIAAYYPELADVAPQVSDFKNENGETLRSYSYSKTITVQQDNGNAMQFTLGAVVIVDRKTGKLEVITVR